MKHSYLTYGGAMLPWATRRLVRAIRKNPILALLIEGFLFFAMAMTLSTPLAWANDGIEEWNDPELTSENSDSGIHVEETGKEAQSTDTSKVDEGYKNPDAVKKQVEQMQNRVDNPEGDGQDKKTDQPSNAKPIGSRAAAEGSTALNSDMLNARTAIGRVNLVVTGLLLPVGIVWASWQIVYLALVCGLLGIDPLDLITKDDEDRPWEAVKKRFSNFAIGLALVGGIWLIFEVVLFLVSNFVGTLETNL